MLAALLFYVVAYLITLFFNTALVGAALMRMEGQNPRLRDGLRIAWSRAGRIVGYACIAATVGLLLRSLEDRVGWIGQLVVKLIGVGWALATFLVVPVMGHALRSRMIDLGTLAGLHEHRHRLDAYCPRCDRWAKRHAIVRLKNAWRRGRDSNPRSAFADAGFQVSGPAHSRNARARKHRFAPNAPRVPEPMNSRENAPSATRVQLDHAGGSAGGHPDSQVQIGGRIWQLFATLPRRKRRGAR